MSGLEVSVEVTVTVNSTQIDPQFREELDSFRDYKVVPNSEYRMRAKRIERKFIIPVALVLGCDGVRFRQRERQSFEDFVDHSD